MLIIIFITIVAAMATIYGFLHMETCYRVTVPAKGKGKKKKNNPQPQAEMGVLFAVIMVLALITRYIAAAQYFGNETDMNCFILWGDMVFNDGLSGFYSSDAFTDYPPGYMYILYVIGALRHLIGVEWDSTLSVVMTKTPAIIADLVTGALLYQVAGKRWNNVGATILVSIYLFAPAVLMDGAIWGQTDAVFTLFVVLMCYLVTERKLIPSYFVFAVGILLKPQTLIFTPVLIFGIIDQVFLDDFSWKKFWKNLGLGIVAILMIGLFMVPFGFKDALAQYKDTMGSYKYASVNAYNVWTLFGKNWTPQTEQLLSISYKTWGTIFIIVVVACAVWIHFRAKNNPSRYYFAGAFIVSGMFLLSVRMHERYIFPAIILVLFAYAMRPRREMAYLYTALASLAFMNMAHVEFYYDPTDFDTKGLVLLLISAGMVAMFGYMVYIAFTLYHGNVSEKELAGQTQRAVSLKQRKQSLRAARNAAARESKKAPKITPTRKMSKFGRVDIIGMIAVTAVYGIVAFVRLGNMSAPETSYSLVEQGEVVLDFGTRETISTLWNYLGYENNPHYHIEYTEDLSYGWTSYEMGIPDEDENAQNYWDAGSVFCWNSVALNIETRYLRITPTEDNYEDSILELVLQGEDGEILTPINTSDYPELFDEQNLFDGRASAMNGTYFDEIYHGRTAYEMIHQQYCYENTHPPLGKIFIAGGILLFGMNPFGWRFAGTLFGVLMVPIIYLFARRFFDKPWISIVTTVLFAFDFMHFVQTRIATIDVFVTLFIMLSYYFMYCYLQTSFYDTKLWKTFIPLGLCGISMGFSWACKWTGFYSAVGLCILFFYHMFCRYREFLYASRTPKGNTEGISHSYIIKNFKTYFMETIVFCCFFFVIIPAIIYVVSYIPFIDGTHRTLLTKVVEAQRTMYDYHSSLEAKHPYSSMWFQWPIMYRPIWYYSGEIGDLREGISAFGNPLVWWAGIPASLYMIYLMIAKKDKGAGFLLVGYLSQYAPWFMVKRVIFIYHYFPSVPFVTMMVGYSLYKLAEWNPKLKKATYVYAAVAVALFALFYPVLSGFPIEPEFATRYLKWFDTWVLLQTW
ncbi:MAG: glycosyltransferase family 39 protein [Lachnospiraceae bacterium]|nr:glycosyltransferase family 39 protein [Lachnospiraceae bacterium]